MTKNRFVQAVGVVAIVYMALQAISWALGAFSRVTIGFGYWVQQSLLPYGGEIALALGSLYLLYAAVTSSRKA
jgi:hypothetical protein